MLRRRSFNVKWNGKPLIDILTEKSHPALQRKPGEPEVNYDYFFDEMEAAERFGYDLYWSKPKAERAPMVLSLRLRSAIRIMGDYEAAERAKSKTD